MSAQGKRGRNLWVLVLWVDVWGGRKTTDDFDLVHFQVVYCGLMYVFTVGGHVVFTCVYCFDSFSFVQRYEHRVRSGHHMTSSVRCEPQAEAEAVPKAFSFQGGSNLEVEHFTQLAVLGLQPCVEDRMWRAKHRSSQISGSRTTHQTAPRKEQTP